MNNYFFSLCYCLWMFVVLPHSFICRIWMVAVFFSGTCNSGVGTYVRDLVMWLVFIIMFNSTAVWLWLWLLVFVSLNAILICYFFSSFFSFLSSCALAKTYNYLDNCRTNEKNTHHVLNESVVCKIWPGYSWDTNCWTSRTAKLSYVI